MTTSSPQATVLARKKATTTSPSATSESSVSLEIKVATNDAKQLYKACLAFGNATVQEEPGLVDPATAPRQLCKNTVHVARQGSPIHGLNRLAAAFGICCHDALLIFYGLRNSSATRRSVSGLGAAGRRVGYDEGRHDKLLTRLEQRGLVLRTSDSHNSKGVKRIHLCDEGIALAKQVDWESKHSVARMMSTLDLSDQREFKRLLNELRGGFDNAED